MNHKKLHGLAKLALWLVPLLPLLYIDGFLFPFVITRTVYFYFLIMVAASLYGLLVFSEWPNYKPKLDFSLSLVILYVAVYGLAALLGHDAYRSFWSTFERMDGFLTLLFVGLFAFLCRQLFTLKKDWLIWLQVAVLASGAVSLYGIAQKFSLLPVYKAGIDRAASTIGNAAFLAGYLLLSAGLAWYLHALEQKRNRMILWRVIIALNIFTLFLTATRSAVLGLAAALFLLASFHFYYLPRRRGKAYLAVFVLATAAIGALLFFNRGYLARVPIGIVQRLTAVSATDVNVKNRLQTWQWAWQSFLEHPALGVGPENFYIEYDKKFDPRVSEDWFDRTHNVYLDQLVQAGAPGLASYLLMWLALFYWLFKRRISHNKEFVVLTSFLLGYALHNFFVFDTINTSFILFFLFVFVSQPAAGADMVFQATARRNFGLVAGLLIMLNVYLVFNLVVEPVRLNHGIFIGYRYIIADPDLSYKSFAAALKHKYGIYEAAKQSYKMAPVILGQADIPEAAKQRYMALVRQLLTEAANINPNDVQNRLYLGELLVSQKDKIDLVEAEGVLRRAVQLSPNRPQPNYLLFNVFVNRGELENGVAVLEAFAQRLPWFSEIKIHLANLVKNKDKAKATKYFEEGMAGDFEMSRANLLGVIEYLLATEQYERATPYLEKITDVAPDSYSYRVDLAKVYRLTNQIDKAVEQINIVNDKAPELLENPEAQRLMGELNALYEKSNSKQR